MKVRTLRDVNLRLIVNHKSILMNLSNILISHLFLVKNNPNLVLATTSI